MKEPGCLVHAHNWINTLAWVCLMLHFGAKPHLAELLVHPTESPTKHSYKGGWVSLSNLTTTIKPGPMGTLAVKMN